MIEKDKVNIIDTHTIKEGARYLLSKFSHKLLVMSVVFLVFYCGLVVAIYNNHKESEQIRTEMQILYNEIIENRINRRELNTMRSDVNGVMDRVDKLNDNK